LNGLYCMCAYLKIIPHISADQISSTVASVMLEHLKTSERTVFWNDALKVNDDPFEGLEGGIFAADWDFKAGPSNILIHILNLTKCHSSSRCYVYSWKCSSHMRPTSRTQSIARGAWFTISTRKRTPPLRHQNQTIPQTKNDYNKFLLARTSTANAIGS